MLAPNQTNSIAHNPFVVGNDFAAISYYEDGLQIISIEDPENPFIAGYFDTRPEGQMYSFKGAWGTYPYLPSGNIIVSDIDNGLFVLKPLFPLRDCERDILLSGFYDHSWEVVSADSIKVNATYDEDAFVDYKAPEGIEFLPNFELRSRSVLEAYGVDECEAILSRKGSYRFK